MRLFGLPEARHYCRGFAPAPGAPATDSVTTLLLASHAAGTSVLAEGTAAFDVYRSCALRNVERSMFQAASLYRRSFDLLTPSAASWAHVTLYYGTFFSAHALLGLFGGYLDPGKWRVEVQASKPGSQQLVVLKSKKAADWGTFSGPHARFWDYFYRAVGPLQPLVHPALAFALVPVSAKPDWLTNERNSVNYNVAMALALDSAFQGSFRTAKVRTTLPGTMNTQFLVFEALLRVTYSLGRDLRLATDALDSLRPVVNRAAKVKRLIYDVRPPRLGHVIRKRGLCC